MAHIPELPPPGHGPQLVEPTASALRWDAAFNRSMVPLRAPSVTTYGSRMSGQLPSMRAASISSSADRRRELLLERQHELTAQLNLVEQMLKQAAPSTCMSTATGVSATSGVTAYSDAPPGAYPVPPPSAPSEAGSVATSVRSRMTDGSASARGRRSGGTPRSERGMTPRSERGATPRTGTPRAGTPREAGTPRLAPTPEMAAVA